MNTEIEKVNVHIAMRSLSNMTMRYMESNSRKSYVDSVTGTNMWILAAVAHSPDGQVFQRDLEEKFGVTRSTVSKVVNLMVQKGLIDRSPVDYDARLKKLSLTPKSKELIKYMEEDGEAMEQALMKGFSKEEKEQLLSYIFRMKENLKGVSDEPCLPPHLRDKK